MPRRPQQHRGQFDDLEALGGVALHLLGDMHFAARYNDDVDERFGVATMCSEFERARCAAEDGERGDVSVRAACAGAWGRSDSDAGHRPGAVCYLGDVGGRRCLFGRDSIYRDGERWKCLVRKKNRKTMLATLDLLAEVEFDVLLANTGASNPVCHVEVEVSGRPRFIEGLAGARKRRPRLTGLPVQWGGGDADRLRRRRSR